jgi:predicted ester cyclase
MVNELVTPETPNVLTVRRFHHDLWNAWNLAVADEILAPNLRFRGSLGYSSVGIQGFKDYFQQVRHAFPDLRSEIHELIDARDVVVARVTWSATHSGEIFGNRPTGRQWSYVAAAIFHFDTGRITDAWIVGDTQEFWRALGVAPRRSE